DFVLTFYGVFGAFDLKADQMFAMVYKFQIFKGKVLGIEWVLDDTGNLGSHFGSIEQFTFLSGFWIDDIPFFAIRGRIFVPKPVTAIDPTGTYFGREYHGAPL